MAGSPIQIRRAGAADADAVARLAGELAQSFALSRVEFSRTYSALLAAEDACLLVADADDDCLDTFSASSISPSTRTGRWPGSRRSWSAMTTGAAVSAAP